MLLVAEVVVVSLVVLSELFEELDEFASARNRYKLT